MSETISWSVTAGGPSGTGINAAGATTGDATVSVSIALDPASGERALALQVDDVDKVTFLAVSSDLTDGDVTVRATAVDATAITGPMLMFGDAVKLFASDLTTLTVENESVDTAANLSVLIGLKV